MEHYIALQSTAKNSFLACLIDVEEQLKKQISELGGEKVDLVATRVLLSDAINQWPQVKAHSLYQDILSSGFVSYVEQPPLNGAKIVLLLHFSDEKGKHAGTPQLHFYEKQGIRYLFHSVRFTADEVKGMDACEQTKEAYRRHIAILEKKGMTLERNCHRTWLYVRDIDRYYADVVKGRNDVFAEQGLTSDKHFIASTGIEGYGIAPEACVGIDFYSVEGLSGRDVFYLQAPEYLNPTYEYGVAFERGTRLSLPCGDVYYISGTASIDKHGECLYHGDVMRQAERLFVNIDELLKHGGAGLADLRELTVYLRDVSDAVLIEPYIHERFPDVATAVTAARVCRPEWLIEVEAIALKRRGA